MNAAVGVATDLLREALARRWFLALGGAITLVIVGLGLTLRLEVVDGALAATSFFGHAMHSDIRSADVALRPVFEAATYVIFYGGLAFGVLACSDFAPELLAPGRIEHVLSLPVRRAEVILGTFLGVLAVSVCGTLYGALGFTLVLSVKSGVWTLMPVVGALLACVAFSAVYAAMLATAVFVRSAAISAALGALLTAFGIVASFRSAIVEAFSGGSAAVFLVLTAPFPRIASLANVGTTLATGAPLDVAHLARLVLGTVAFGLACVAVAIWEFERRDY
jgi:Cu-processing system permease protein